jgi:hypothetical protein
LKLAGSIFCPGMMSGHGSMERESPRDSSPPYIFPTNSLESILSTVFSSEGLSLIVPINIPVFWKRPLFRVLAWRRWCQHGHSDCAQIICRRQHTTDRSAGTYTNSEGIIPNPRYSPTAIFLALSSLLHGIWLRKLVVSKNSKHYICATANDGPRWRVHHPQQFGDSARIAVAGALSLSS